MAFLVFTNTQRYQKIKSYSHGEFNTEENTNEYNIEKKIRNNQDILVEDFLLRKLLLMSLFLIIY